ncbi:cysteine-rich venom protein ophanin-like [Ylistrum balloti]|uniref:cysteine-rich venom protein ophanin-like n=1 Tax=Ylistrum balloti TaxID=509963 RepID=UPI00290592F7|nr:cysteine-rich venom protein ophanin-like [Ylistrum balloti]
MWSYWRVTWTLVILVTTGLVVEGCHEKFEVISGHSACLSKSPKVSASGILQVEKTEIVALHNHYRQQVTHAVYMQKIRWDDEVAMVASKWAENCRIGHDLALARYIPGRFSVGQNIVKGSANSKRNWTSTVESWYNEKNSFTYGGSNMLGQVGHYTQLVWADTYLVGCGFALCGSLPFYVCDYGPSGNIGQFDKPYNRTSGSLRKLTDCSGISCHGDRRLTPSCTCECDPQLHPAFTAGKTCQLDCKVKDVSSTCGPTGTYKQTDCNNAYVTFYCPHMCRSCPYADPHFISQSSAGNLALNVTLPSYHTTEPPGRLTNIKHVCLHIIPQNHRAD